MAVFRDCTAVGVRLFVRGDHEGEQGQKDEREGGRAGRLSCRLTLLNHCYLPRTWYIKSATIRLYKYLSRKVRDECALAQQKMGVRLEGKSTSKQEQSKIPSFHRPPAKSLRL